MGLKPWRQPFLICELKSPHKGGFPEWPQTLGACLFQVFFGADCSTTNRLQINKVFAHLGRLDQTFWCAI